MKKLRTIFCIIATMLVVMLCVVTPTATAFAENEAVEVAEAEKTAGEKIRDWVYMQAAPLIAGVSSSAVIAAIVSMVGGLINRKLKKRMTENTSGINSLTSDIRTLYKSTKSILDEVGELKIAIEAEVSTLKKLKLKDDVAAVEAKIDDVIEQTEELATDAEDVATPFLRS